MSHSVAILVATILLLVRFDMVRRSYQKQMAQLPGFVVVEFVKLFKIVEATLRHMPA